MGVLPLREKKYLCYIIIKHCPKNGKLTYKLYDLTEEEIEIIENA